MKKNNRKRLNLYTQGQRLAARVLVIVGFISVSSGSALAVLPGPVKVAQCVYLIFGALLGTGKGLLSMNNPYTELECGVSDATIRTDSITDGVLLETGKELLSMNNPYTELECGVCNATIRTDKISQDVNNACNILAIAAKNTAPDQGCILVRLEEYEEYNVIVNGANKVKQVPIVYGMRLVLRLCTLIPVRKAHTWPSVFITHKDIEGAFLIAVTMGKKAIETKRLPGKDLCPLVTFFPGATIASSSVYEVVD